MTDHVVGRQPRILVLGDLHADSWWHVGDRVLQVTGIGRWILDSAPDLLIVAGDIADNPRQNWIGVLREIEEYILPHDVIILPGNHDYYRFSLDGDDELGSCKAG